MMLEEQEEHKVCLFKSKHYLMKILDESSSDVSVTEKVSNSCLKACFERCIGLCYYFKMKPFAFKSDFLDQTLLKGKLNLFFPT